MKPSKYLGHFLDTVSGFTAQMLRHYLWKVIDQQITPEQAIKYLPRTMKRKLLTKQACRLKGSQLSLDSLKQSYKKQRLNLYYQHDFDSLAALLIFSVNQAQKLKHDRPTTAEKFAYGQFLYLFGYKYRTLKKLEMGKKINLLIAVSSSETDCEILKQRITSDFEKLEKIKAIGMASQVKNLDQFVSNEILKNILTEPNHHYFYS